MMLIPTLRSYVKVFVYGFITGALTTGMIVVVTMIVVQRGER